MIEDIQDKHLDKEVNKIVNHLAKKNEVQPPDARLHQLISFFKSGVRIVGYIFIPFNLVAATVLLILSEVVGIIEELV